MGGGTAGDWGVCQLWHVDVTRRPVALSAAMVEAVGRAALGESPALTPPDLLYLRFQRALRGAGGALAAGWPTLLPADVELLSPPLAAGGRRLLREVVLPVMERLAGHPWWRRIGEDDAYRHAALRLLLDYGTDRVFAAGLMPAVPDGEAPPAWGRLVWLGHRGDALPRSLDAEPDPVASGVTP